MPVCPENESAPATTFETVLGSPDFSREWSENARPIAQANFVLDYTHERFEQPYITLPRRTYHKPLLRRDHISSHQREDLSIRKNCAPDLSYSPGNKKWRTQVLLRCASVTGTTACGEIDFVAGNSPSMKTRCQISRFSRRQIRSPLSFRSARCSANNLRTASRSIKPRSCVRGSSSILSSSSSCAPANQ